MNPQIQRLISRDLIDQENNKSPKLTNGSKRDKIELVAEILRSCLRGKRKTNIMYSNNLNYTQLRNYLDLLTSRNLIALKNRKYTTTEKGIAFIKTFTDINRLLTIENPQHHSTP